MNRPALVTAAATALAAIAFAAAPAAAQPVTWNGYVQARLAAGPAREGGFSIRRAKLWVKGPTPFTEALSFKVQGIFKRSAGSAFVLQDVYGEYAFGSGALRFGQLVPDFSLQRSQPDALVPTSERAAIVDAMIPAAETGARDVGAELLLGRGSPWHVSLGIFNGTGRDAEDFTDRRPLVTHRATVAIPLGGDVRLTVGESFALRTVTEARYRRIMGADPAFTGRDLRWGAEARLSSDAFSIQGEVIEARLEDRVAHGWYALGHAYLGARAALTGSVEWFDDLDPDTESATLIAAGFTRLLSGDDAKILVEVRTRPGAADHATQFLTQFQLFFKHFGRQLS